MEELLPARLGVEPSLVETLSNSLHKQENRVNRAMDMLLQHIHGGDVKEASGEGRRRQLTSPRGRRHSLALTPQFGHCTGGATAQRVCSDCFEPGHTSCKLVEAPKLSQAKSKEERKPRYNPYPKSRTGKICWLFIDDGRNIEKDIGQPCCFRHICLRCKSEGHPVSQCPRSRTPHPSAFGGRH